MLKFGVSTSIPTETSVLTQLVTLRCLESLCGFSVHSCVIYTGVETRSRMNNNEPRSKTGVLDEEVDFLVKICVAAVVVLSVVMVSLKGFHGPWWNQLIRFILLFSYIVPTSLRANLDIGKVCYAYMIQADKNIPNTVVRSTTIPEELGRINYLLTDKTGTLTKNEMIFKRLHVGDQGYGAEGFGEIKSILARMYDPLLGPDTYAGRSSVSAAFRKSDSERVRDAVWSIALCHNVTPVYDATNAPQPEEIIIDRQPREHRDCTDRSSFSSTSYRHRPSEYDNIELGDPQTVVYQASSPDEVALVEWTAKMGLRLISRDIHRIKLETPQDEILVYRILDVFPFTSDRRRMGIIVQDESTREITLLMKGELSRLER